MLLNIIRYVLFPIDEFFGAKVFRPDIPKISQMLTLSLIIRGLAQDNLI